MLKKRVITALWSIPLLIAAVWFDRPLPWFTILAAIYGLIAAFEFHRLVAPSKIPVLAYFSVIYAVLFVISPHFNNYYVVPLLLTSAMLLSAIIVVLHPQKDGAFTNWAWTMAGILYTGWLLSYLVAIRLDAGRDWLFLALFATFGSDSAAFFIGRAVGRHRMAPRISPNKTWEGAIAGVISAVIVSLVVTALLDLPLNYAQAILLGLLVSVFGQLGDLVESLLKRNVGVKESGKLMPGHGGLLDRMDSVVFAGIVVYYFFLFGA